MIRILIIANVIINVDNDTDANNLLSKGAWEMPPAEVQRIFGDKANLACNANTSFEPDGKGGYINFVFTPPAADISLLRSQKKTEAENALTAKIAEITPHYPTDEKLSFDVQEAEAILYTENPDIDENKISCITGIARARQMELSVLSEKILAKSVFFKKMSGYYMGLKQRIEDLADKAQTEEEINAIDVQAIFGEPMQPVEPEPETNSESETSPEATE